MINYETLSEAVNDLRKRDYTYDFNLSEHCIECKALSASYTPSNFIVEEFHRFDGGSDPGDESVVYAIRADQNIKGILVDAYGTYTESLSFDMIQKLRLR